MRAAWGDLSDEISKNCWKHTGLLNNYDGFEPALDLTHTGMLNIE